MKKEQRTSSVNDELSKSCAILVVEDNKILSHLIEVCLKEMGHSVDVANSGTMAIDMITNNPPDLILMDSKLPDISARQIIESIRECQFEIPFVIMTEHGDERVAVEMMKAGARDHMVKGGNFMDLLPLVVKQILKQIVNEKKLIETEDHLLKLSHAVKQSPAIVVITDTDANIKYVNAKFTKVTGYTSEEAIRKNMSILKSHKTTPEVYKELWDTILSGNEWQGELCNKKKNGELYWEHTSISSVKNYDGVITDFIAVKEDITARKQAETLATGLGQILDDSLNEIYIFDAKTFKFIQANKGARKNLGYSIDELSGLTPLDIKPEFTKKLFESKIEPLQTQKKSKMQFVTVHQRKDGSLYDVEVHLQLSSFLALPVFVAIVLDITERKKIEKSLIQSEKLKSIGIITLGIAHEFNNILAIIAGNVHLLEEYYKDDKKLMERLRTIKTATDDGVGISSRMLEFTRTESKTTEYVTFDLIDLIKQTIDFTTPRWKSMAQASTIQYHMDMDGIKEASSIILCNPTEIREVFINIIYNSLDAMPNGGRISFNTWSKMDIVFVSVSDTGNGMTEYAKTNIFVPFFTTRKPKGIGLGMSNSFGIIKRHGGCIEVDSEKGKGSTFTLQFPTTRKTVSPKVSSRPEMRCGNIRILVVDDEEAICRLLYKFLSDKCREVKTVLDGTKAIELARKERFDLVLCDMSMPNVCGYDVVKALNKLDERPKIGIITGWGEKLKSMDTDKMKVDFIAKKPFNFQKLAMLINNLFSDS